MSRNFPSILRLVVAAAMILTLASVLPPAPVAAQVTLIAPTAGPVGTAVTVTATGYAPSSILTATFDGAPVTTAPVVVETSVTGAATFALLIPAASAGAHLVKVSDGVNSVTNTFTVQPKVTISPTLGPVGTTATVTGSGFAAGVTADVTVGGVSFKRMVAIDSDGSFTTESTIPIVPSGAQVVTAADGAGNNADLNTATFWVTAPPTPGEVQNWAVIIGISDYPGIEDDLFYCREDAEAVRDVLLTSQLWSSDNIFLLTDSDATMAAISSALSTVAVLSDADDAFLFYFSGHGGYWTDRDPIDEWDGYDEYLLPYDFAEWWMWDDWLAESLAALPMNRIAVAIDACFSGGMIRRTSRSDAAALVGSASTPQVGDGFVRDLDDVLEGVVLAAAAENELSMASPFLEHGIFTYYLVEALSGGSADANGNGLVSMEEAFLYLYPRVSSYWPVPPNQHPMIHDSYAGEFEILDLRTPVLPCRLYGTVQLDGADVPDGTVIKAIVGGTEYATTTPALTQALPAGIPEVMSITDEFTAMVYASDRADQIIAFGEMSDAINAVGDAQALEILRQIVIRGGQSEELGGVETLNLGSYLLTTAAAAATAFPAEWQPMLELADEVAAWAAVETDLAAKGPLWADIIAAVDAIGNAELSTLAADVQTVLDVATTTQAPNWASNRMISWILESALAAAGYGSSSYAIMIQEPDGADYDGAAVTFMIGDRTADQSSTWTSGGNVEVNLSSGPPPELPCRFYGTVALDGADVPDGTVIKAVVSGTEFTTTTPAAGYGSSSYAIMIQEPDGADYDGVAVTFTIGDRTADQSSTWTSGGNVEVDLSTGPLPLGYRDIALVEGWNLVAFPLVLADGAIGAVFPDIIDNVLSIWAYDGATESWLVYTPSPAADSLTEVIDCQGYWINMSQDDTLTVWGTPGLLYQ